MQAAKSTWTRADLLKQLALVLPVETRSMVPEAAVALLHELADEALAGSVEQVVCLEAPQWPPLPDYLRRPLDGRSVYTRPGTTRYATRVQLEHGGAAAAAGAAGGRAAPDPRHRPQRCSVPTPRTLEAQLVARAQEIARRDDAARACAWIRAPRCTTR